MSKNLLDILYIDDDTNDRLLVEAACDQSGLMVNPEAIPDGAKAIDYLNGIGIYSDRVRFPLSRVILLDLKMPIKSGFEVLEWINNQLNLKYIPVIIFSASKLEVDIKRSYDLGANAYVVKPNTMAGLMEMIAALKAFWIDLNEQPKLSCDAGRQRQ